MAAAFERPTGNYRSSKHMTYRNISINFLRIDDMSILQVQSKMYDLRFSLAFVPDV